MSAALRFGGGNLSGSSSGEEAPVFFFPLRTNVQYFDTPEGFLTLEQRLKQALILYDRVLLQSGAYQAHVGPKGAFDLHLPPDNMPDQMELQRLRDVNSVAGEFTVSFQTDTTPPYRQVFTSPRECLFSGEFHSLYSTARESADFEGLELTDVVLNDAGKQHAELLKQNYLRSEDPTLPDGSTVLQGHIVGGFFRDLVLTSALGCAASMDPLHTSILDFYAQAFGGFRTAPGVFALEFEVPSVASLSWEEIAQLRADPALTELRERWFIAERTARESVSGADENEIKEAVRGILHAELIEELRRRVAPKGGELAAAVSWQLAGGLIPPLGLLQTGLSVGQLFADSSRDWHSWLAVLMRLRQH